MPCCALRTAYAESLSRLYKQVTDMEHTMPQWQQVRGEISLGDHSSPLTHTHTRRSQSPQAAAMQANLARMKQQREGTHR